MLISTPSAALRLQIHDVLYASIFFYVTIKWSLLKRLFWYLTQLQKTFFSISATILDYIEKLNILSTYTYNGCIEVYFIKNDTSSSIKFTWY